jgi:hypothetical protein
MNVDHELSVPVTVEAHPDQIVARTKFSVPYIKVGPEKSQRDVPASKRSRRYRDP